MNKRKGSVLPAAAFFMMVLFSGTVFAYGWQAAGGRWWYGTSFDNSSYYSGGWQLIDGLWYYFDGDGWMVQDQWVGDYYLGSSGAMLTNTRTPDGYWVGSDGKWIPGRTQEKASVWTGEYYVWKTCGTALYGNEGQGVDLLEMDRNHLHIKGYFRKVDDYKEEYLGYHDKTLEISRDCTFWKDDQDGDDDLYTWKDFYHELITHNGMKLTLIVVDDLVLRVVLSS